MQYFSYELGKLNDAIFGQRPSEMALVDIQTLRPKVDSFDEQLRAVGGNGYEFEAKHEVAHVRRALDHLEHYFQGTASEMDDMDAAINYGFVTLKLDELKERYFAE